MAIQYINFILDENLDFLNTIEYLIVHFKTNIIYFLYIFGGLIATYLIYNIFTFLLYRNSSSYRESIFKDQVTKEIDDEIYEKYIKKLKARIREKELLYLSGKY